MTVVRNTMIYCDGDNCPRTNEPLNAEPRSSWLEPAAQQLRESGWARRPGGTHLCPECIKAAQPQARRGEENSDEQ